MLEQKFFFSFVYLFSFVLVCFVSLDFLVFCFLFSFLFCFVFFLLCFVCGCTCAVYFIKVTKRSL